MNQIQDSGFSQSNFPNNPEEFDSDDRISFSKLDNKFILVQDDGTEFEYDENLRRWISTVDEALLEEQRKAYRVSGVDESEPVEAGRKRRKNEYVNGAEVGNRHPNINIVDSLQEGGRAVRASKKQKPPHPPRENTAVYVTGLPLDVTVEEVHDVFSKKCGVIAEEIDSGKPRIKLYTDEKGQFKGDALIVFFKAPSVKMAIDLLDDYEFRIGAGENSGRMRVQPAESSYKKVQHNESEEKERTRTTTKDKQKIIKKTQKLDARLADWSDDEPSSILETSSRFDKVVVLKHMFTLEELAEDSAAILDIKEDIREECSKIGEVTNVVLFDLEAEGIATVRFVNTEAAQACTRLMNGRNFGGQKVVAYISDGKEHFKKSRGEIG